MALSLGMIGRRIWTGPGKRLNDWIGYYCSAFWNKGLMKEDAGRRCFSVMDSNIVKPVYPEAEIPEMPFHEFIFENIARWEDKTAVKCAASGKTLTFKILRRQSKALATSLQKKFDLKKGDTMAVILPNCPEYMVIYLAGSMAGVRPTTINPVYTPSEISQQLKDSESKLIFTTPELHGKCAKSLALINFKCPIVVVKSDPNAETPSGATFYGDLIDESSSQDLSPVPFDPNDDLVLPYSSGTSGLPKGVRLSHKNIIANLVQYAMGSELKSNPNKETNQCSVLGVLPMFHIYGMVIVTFDALREGARVVSLPRFEPKLFVETIYAEKTEILYLAPPLVFFLSNQSMVEPKHLEYTQSIVVGAAPCGESDLKKLMKKGRNLKVFQGYGLTETSPMITMTYKNRFNKLSSVGCPVASTLVKVKDLTSGATLPAEKRGEICVSGPQVMKGYLNRPEETKEAFDSEGWFRTGDIGYYDEEGDFYVIDRRKELIKVKGFQVAPAELEEVLRNHENIADAGVIGVENAELGQVPRAFVVVKKGATLTEKEIQDYIKDRLSSYKQLKGGVKFVKEIPKSTSGKILRRELKNLNDES